VNDITPVRPMILFAGSVLPAEPSRHVYGTAATDLPEEMKLSYRSLKSEAAAFELKLSLRALI